MPADYTKNSIFAFYVSQSFPLEKFNLFYIANANLRKCRRTEYSF